MACVDYEQPEQLGQQTVSFKDPMHKVDASKLFNGYKDPTPYSNAPDIFKDIYDYLSQYYVQCHHDIPPVFGINFNYPDKLPNVQIELRFRTIKKDEEAA